jgi:hypothetical protein
MDPAHSASGIEDADLVHDLLEYFRIDARPRPFKRIHFRKVFDKTIRWRHPYVNRMPRSLAASYSGGRLLPIGGTDAKPQGECHQIS